jgi:hypothetical protein
MSSGFGRRGTGAIRKPIRGSIVFVLFAAAAIITGVAGGSGATATSAQTGAPMADKVELRERFFGSRNVDGRGRIRPNRVILAWAGTSTFAAAIGGHVVLLDGYVAEAAHQDYVPTSPAELVALRPKYVFLGHRHFDHAADLGEILAASEATLVGTPAHCAEARRQRPGVKCEKALPDDARFGQSHKLNQLLRRVKITVIKHKHSPALSPQSPEPQPFIPGEGDGSCAPHPEVEDPNQHPPSIAEGLQEIEALGAAPTDGGTLLWQFRVKGFVLTYGDSSASVDATPQAVQDAIRGLPRTDVFTGSIASLNQGARCMRDPRMYMELLRARLFMPNHHDSYTIWPFAGPGAQYESRLQEEISRIPAERRPCLLFITDPEDYVRELVFKISRRDPCRGRATSSETRAAGSSARDAG